VLARRISLEIIPVCIFTLFAVLFVLYLLSTHLGVQPASEIVNEYPLAES
jgi:hypothetical protein